MKLFKHKKKKNLRPTATVLSDDGVKNSANALFANIRFMEVDSRIRNIVITSSIPNEGKSTIAIALAAAVGASGHTCLLVEADMRRRSLANALNVHPKYGLYALLSDGCTVAEAMGKTKIKNVAFLNTEPGIPAPESILSSKRFEKLMADLAGSFDYVIYDTPPLGAFPDAAVVASKADGTILVMREDYADRTEAIRSVETLRGAHANLLGTVLNGQKTGADGGYGYAYAYTYSYQEVPANDPRAQEQLRKLKTLNAKESHHG